MTDATDLDRSPATLSAWIAVWCGVFAWSVTVPYTIQGGVIGVLGVIFVAISLWQGERLLLSTGSSGLLLAILLAAGDGAPPLLVLAGTAATILAWDIGQHAISLGNQLGSEAETTRAEVAHIASSALVGSGIVVVAYVASTLPTRTQPLISIVFLLLAAGLLAIAFGPRDLLSIEIPE